MKGVIVPKEKKEINELIPIARVLTGYKFNEYGIYYGWGKSPLDLSYHRTLIIIQPSGELYIHILREYNSRFHSIDLIISGFIETELSIEKQIKYINTQITSELIFV